ncbi:hydroxyethylthiazole kinase [Marinomonas atlantica]|uniref:hydroxyethylthiazole kinase n=1 Tax=Marinomonas atlantica TaxID=1806668 RepID=UPI000834B69B|nr:hydroxyethylthiazole kinase [Marinomonas atlantica]
MTPELIAQALTSLRQQKPLVVNITNFVVMNNTANALLAVGASPIMAHSREEMADMMSFAGALVINIGTLDKVWVERMAFAIEQANANQTPVILDPVGCGATAFRTATSRHFADLAERLIIRGNASEIIALAGEVSQGIGVDARDSSQAALSAAKALVDEYQANVVVSGEVDYIVTKDSVFSLNNGHSMMPQVTGTGCSLSALTGAFAAIGETTGLAAAAVMGVAGEIAGQDAKGPGSLQTALLDALFALDENALIARLKLAQL